MISQLENVTINWLSYFDTEKGTPGADPKDKKFPLGRPA